MAQLPRFEPVKHSAHFDFDMLRGTYYVLVAFLDSFRIVVVHNCHRTSSTIYLLCMEAKIGLSSSECTREPFSSDTPFFAVRSSGCSKNVVLEC